MFFPWLQDQGNIVLSLTLLLSCTQISGTSNKMIAIADFLATRTFWFLWSYFSWWTLPSKLTSLGFGVKEVFFSFYKLSLMYIAYPCHSHVDSLMTDISMWCWCHGVNSNSSNHRYIYVVQIPCWQSMTMKILCLMMSSLTWLVALTQLLSVSIWNPFHTSIWFSTMIWDCISSLWYLKLAVIGLLLRGWCNGMLLHAMYV